MDTAPNNIVKSIKNSLSTIVAITISDKGTSGNGSFLPKNSPKCKGVKVPPAIPCNKENVTFLPDG